MGLSSETRAWLIKRAKEFKNARTSDFAAVRRAFAAKGLRYHDSIMDKHVHDIVKAMNDADASAA